MNFILFKHIKLTTFVFTIVVLLFSGSTINCKKFGDTTDTNVPDTSEITGLKYPPLTERDGLGLTIPKPPDEHPRLCFRKQDIPVIKAKISNPLMLELWNKIIRSSALSTSGALVQDGSLHNLDVNIQNAIEAKALICAISDDGYTGRMAIDALLNFYGTLKIDQTKKDVYNDIGRVILTGAVVYDWCYNYLTLKEKQTLIFRMENLATKLEIQWPKLVQGSVVGHGSELQLARNMLACGIATYNEKPEIYNLAAGRVIAEFIPARKFFYPASYHHQGSSYGTTRFYADIWTTFLFDRMGYPLIYDSDQGNVPYFWVYLRRPDGQYFRDGDEYIEIWTQFGKYWANPSDMMTGSYFDDPLILGDVIKQGQIGMGKDYLFDYLFFNTNVAVSYDKSSLPLTKHFKEPLGAMIARTGWDEGITSNTVVAFLKIGVYNFANHQHLDAGSFQLYYKAPLAIESGIYSGTMGEYGSDHFKNYYQRTIAHNSMLVYNPNEMYSWHSNPIINDGGQQYQNNGTEPQNLSYFLSKDYKTGQVLAWYYGPDPVKPDVSYLKGELAESYSEKVKSFKRSFVFLNLNNTNIPAALIVFDHVEASSKDYQKFWLLHSVEEPLVSGNTSIIKRSEKGYNGKMVTTTLLPYSNNLAINKTGGPGKEYMVFNTNFPQSYTTQNNSADGAAWRLEISPKEPSLTDNFLNVMQVMDYTGGPDQPLPVQLIESEKLTGIKIGDRIVLFSKNSDIITDTLTIEISGENYVFIADLKEGNWKVDCPSNIANSLGLIRNENQILYFKAKEGNYVITKQ